MLETILSNLTLQRSHILAYQLDLKDALHGEQKSTAGDKHDTSRAMIHLEQENLQHQYNELQLQIQHVVNLKSQVPSTKKALFGTLIRTENELFLLGLGLGKQVVDNKIIYCVGMETPIGKQLINKAIGDTIFFNGKQETLLEII